MKVHEIMTAHARCAAPDNTLVEAAGLMRHLDVGVLPVCENDRLAGMVTDRDIVLRGVADGRNVNSALVRDVMSPGVIYVFAEQDVEEAARLMEEKQVRRMPVLNRQKRLVGILSLGDIAVSSHPAFSGQALREVSQSPEEHMRGGRTAGSVRRQKAYERMRTSGIDHSGHVPAGTRKSGGRGTRKVVSRRAKRSVGAAAKSNRGSTGRKKTNPRRRSSPHARKA